MAPPVTKTRTTDSLQKKPQLSNFKTTPHYSQFDMMSYGKENIHPQVFPAPTTINLTVESYYQNSNGKRGLMEAAQIKDSRPAKKCKAEEPALPSYDSFPSITDDGSKPAHSYAQLIGMAILRSPLRRLTLAQIYKWISDNYSFYNPTDAGWQNSIRHNLSLHKNFIKIERPKDDPGKGNYWGIEPGTEAQFLKDRLSRKPAPTGENIPVMSTRLEPSMPFTASPLHQEPGLPPLAGAVHYSALPPLPPTPQAASATVTAAPSSVPVPPSASASTTLPMPEELSSDATIPVSDSIGQDDDASDKIAEVDLPGECSTYSPPPANMNSSPPVSRHSDIRSGTPPPMPRDPVSSKSRRSHKRKFASMDDSGYISSLESSAMRPNQKALLLTSEADRPRLKRGRAEEEIARIRNSSPLSPTKSRSLSYGPISSSPLRQAHDHVLAPLTPVLKMKPPAPPPPSASPNTNLRIHRDKVRHMLQSPLRREGLYEDGIPWSPAFNLDDAVYTFDDMAMQQSTEFDIFQDFSGLDHGSIFPSIGSADAGSPVKRSVKRARLDRSVSSSALADVTNSASKKGKNLMPLFKISENSPSRFFETPSKAFEGLGSPSKLFQQQSPSRMASPIKFPVMLDMALDAADWPCMGPGGPDDDSTPGGADFTGLDILQGFEKIGAKKKPSSQKPPPKGGKPSINRSFSTAF